MYHQIVFKYMFTQVFTLLISEEDVFHDDDVNSKNLTSDEVNVEETADDSVPPQSPVRETRAPLASEENLLSGLGTTTVSRAFVRTFHVWLIFVKYILY